MAEEEASEGRGSGALVLGREGDVVRLKIRRLQNALEDTEAAGVPVVTVARGAEVVAAATVATIDTRC